MRIAVFEKSKKDVFVSLFQVLKICSSTVTIYFKKDNMYIQGMDKSHVCLFEINMVSGWFDKYEGVEEDYSICVSTQFFYNILSTAEENHQIQINYDPVDDSDSIFIELLVLDDKKGSYNKYFKLPLCDMESSLLNITTSDYDAEFSISSKKINDIVSQLSIFGDIINIHCCEEKIDLVSSGIGGDMRVSIPIDDITEFAICEDAVINVSYSLTYIQKMCITTKLSKDIQFFVSEEQPLKIKYDLGVDSFLHFFIAPKIGDE